MFKISNILIFFFLIATFPAIAQVDITYYLPSKEKATGTGVLLFPGGGYGFLATDTEATPVTKYLLEKGIAAFVIKYRLPNDKMHDRSMGPLMEAQYAIRTVREKADTYNLDQKMIGVMGFSAGGHLAALLGTHFSVSYIPNPDSINLRPDFMILLYPVISMDSSITHWGSRINLLGTTASADKVTFFSNEKNVTKQTPPVYLTHASSDGIVSAKNSITMYEALHKAGVPAELHLFPSKEHTFLLKEPTAEWMAPVLQFLKKQKFLK